MRRLILAIVLLAVLIVASTAYAAPPGGAGRYDLVKYSPPYFQVEVWLGEPNFVSIGYDGEAFTVHGSQFDGAMSPETLAVLGDAIDFAIDLAGAMPQ